MSQAVGLIDTGEGDKAAALQQQGESVFLSLGEIVEQRIETLAERERLSAYNGLCAVRVAEIALYIERQLVVLEQTEDRADDGGNTARIADHQERLAHDVQKIRATIGKNSHQRADALLGMLGKAIHSMRTAVPALKANTPDDSFDHQEAALAALEAAMTLVSNQGASAASLAATLKGAWMAQGHCQRCLQRQTNRPYALPQQTNPQRILRQRKSSLSKLPPASRLPPLCARLRPGLRRFAATRTPEPCRSQQNFARELPLESRAILKIYYERLAK